MLLRELGAGGMGTVFAAYDEQLDRKVALKLLQSSLTTADQRQRVVREAQAMARVSHSNVVHVYDVGELGGHVFIAMEFIDGSNLTAWEKAQPRSWQETLSVYRQAAEGLLAAHRNGLVHRDFKPDNVLVDRDGRVRVADFGLAQVRGQAPSASDIDASPAEAGALRLQLSAEGTICGTPGYMSPEQYRAEVVDSRSDQFSFCAALYSALFGRLPFAGATFAEQAAHVLGNKLLPPPDDTLVPRTVRSAILRGLAHDPAERFPSMTELLAELTTDIELDPTTARAARRRLSLAISLGVMLLMMATVGKLMRGGLTHRLMVTISGALIVLMACVTVAFRKTLLRHTFHRRVFRLIMMTTCAWFGVRCLGLAHQIPLPQMIPIDLMVIGGLYGTVALEYLPGVWWFSASAIAGAIVSTVYPQIAEPIYLAIYTAVSFIMSLAWEQVSHQRKTQKAKPGRQSTSRSSPSSE